MTYELDGTFTSATSLDATFSVSYSGGSACYDCTDQSWSLTGSR